MALNNPAFANSPAFNGRGVPAIPTPSADQLQQQFNMPSAPERVSEPMTYDGTVRISLLNFAVMLVSAGAGWILGGAIPFLFIGAMIAGLVLGLVNTFKKEPSPGLILGYAVAQGVFVGAISMFFEFIYPGIVGQAVLATFAVVGVTLFLFMNGKVRASARATKIFLIVLVGYGVFSLINLIGVWTGMNDNPFGMRGSVELFGIPLGVILGVLAVLLGAYSLVLDFDFVQRGVRNSVDKKYQWTAAFGILMTVIWLYVEILRMIAITRE